MLLSFSKKIKLNTEHNINKPLIFFELTIKLKENNNIQINLNINKNTN